MKIVQICGGLGCQLLDTATYYSLAQQEQVFVDKQYFVSARKQTCSRPWDLEEYCSIPLESLPSSCIPEWEIRYAQSLAETRLYARTKSAQKQSAIRLIKSAIALGSCLYRKSKRKGNNHFNHRRDYICEGSSSSLAIEFLKSEEGRKCFALNPALAEQAKQTSLDLCEQQTLPLAIHVRQGDYLIQASKISGIEFPISLLSTLPTAWLKATTCATWISDSELDLELIYKKLPHINHRCLIEGNPLIAHALMRKAEILITSNSTFSFTAGLLSGKPFLTPSQWYAEDNSMLDTSRNAMALSCIF